MHECIYPNDKCGLSHAIYRPCLHVRVLQDFPVSKDGFASQKVGSSKFKFGAVCENLTAKYLLKSNQ